MLFNACACRFVYTIKKNFEMKTYLLLITVLLCFNPFISFSQELQTSDFTVLSSIRDTTSIDQTIAVFKTIYSKHHTKKSFDSLLVSVINNSENRMNLAIAIGGYGLNKYWDSTNFDNPELYKKILVSNIEFQSSIMKSKADSDTKFMAKGDKCVLELILGINFYIRNQKEEAANYFKSAKKVEFWDMCFPVMENEKLRDEIIDYISKL